MREFYPYQTRKHFFEVCYNSYRVVDVSARPSAHTLCQLTLQRVSACTTELTH